MIDPGHGGRDPGAIGPTGLRESDVALSVSKALFALLEPIVSCRLTRERDVALGSDVNRDLQERVRIANAYDASVFISIHCNAATAVAARGIETYCYMRGGNGEKLAQLIQKNLVQALGLLDRGVKTASFYVIRHTKMPAVLVELGFITNPEEEKLLREKSFQQKAAQAIAEAVATHFGLSLPKESEIMSKGPFPDVPMDRWSAKEIQEALDRGIVQGDDKGNFNPQRALTREEGVTLINRAINYLLSQQK
ncbi:N-acetylmuramoyl-L-alanine amidase [Heliorestis convoluta]|nr:N-acetylmuramoyl-L-alanine amidase [Heliorestis convoluta]